MVHSWCDLFAVQLKHRGNEKILSPRYIFIGGGGNRPPRPPPGIDATGHRTSRALSVRPSVCNFPRSQHHAVRLRRASYTMAANCALSADYGRFVVSQLKLACVGSCRCPFSCASSRVRCTSVILHQLHTVRVLTVPSVL